MFATPPLRRAVLCCAAAMLLFTTGCGGGDDSPSAPESIAGTYVMRTVNGNPPPVVLAQYTDESGSYKLEVLSGSITLEQGGTYQENHTFRETLDGEVQAPEDAPENGTWVREGSVVTLRTSDGYTVVTSYSAGALTLAQGPYTVRYAR